MITFYCNSRAAINNRVQIAHYLIDQGAHVNYQGGFLMETPLHWAIRKNFYTGRNKSLLIIQNNINSNWKFIVAKLLIDSGANFFIQSNKGIDSIHLACQLGITILSAYFFVSVSSNQSLNRQSQYSFVTSFLASNQ